MLTELELDHCFWNAVRTDARFRAWFISKTKFASKPLELVTNELWHQRWYKDTETKRESETDITLIFRDPETEHLYSIHIENKTPHRAWEEHQAESYRGRALNRMAKWKHMDCEVALLAPRKHIEDHPIEANHFDFKLTYEEVGNFVKEFENASS